VTLRFLLDTNTVSEPLRPIPNPGILARLQEHRGEIGIAAPVWHELVFGCRLLPPSRKRRAIETYLFHSVRPSFPILAYDEKAAEWHAVERARLVSIGKTPPFIDGQIAAIAQVAGLVLVTANGSDFERFQGLKTENWQS
jgi:tRNA(fMet)-specific endonuclease VapC